MVSKVFEHPFDLTKVRLHASARLPGVIYSTKLWERERRKEQTRGGWPPLSLATRPASIVLISIDAAFLVAELGARSRLRCEHLTEERVRHGVSIRAAIVLVDPDRKENTSCAEGRQFSVSLGRS